MFKQISCRALVYVETRETRHEIVIVLIFMVVDIWWGEFVMIVWNVTLYRTPEACIKDTINILISALKLCNFWWNRMWQLYINQWEKPIQRVTLIFFNRDPIFPCFYVSLINGDTGFLNCSNTERERCRQKPPNWLQHNPHAILLIYIH